MGALGDELVALVASARDELLLVAPFMTVGATRRVLAAARADVGRVTLVTRWRPEEVAAKASDLEVLDLVEARPDARLLLHPRLHAKLYRADDRVLVGSANLTDTALGWVAEPNLEILTRHPDPVAARTFEADLLAAAHPATPEMRDVVRSLVPDGPAAPPIAPPWLPRCASPHEIWKIYAGADLGDVLDASRRAGKADLAALALPAGLGAKDFEAEVSRRFLKMPLVARTLARMGADTSDEEGARLLSSGVLVEHIPYGSAATAWSVLKRWLSVFGGGEFRSKPVGEVIARGWTR